MDFRFLEVDKNDTEMLEKVFAFRYKIFLEIYPEYLIDSNCIDNKESDIYDQYATQFIALDNDDNILATVRMIHSSPIGYPTENSLQFDNTQFQKDKLGEMSRIFVDPKYRSVSTTKKIFYEVKKSIYFKMMELDIEYTYGSLEDNFLRLLKIYKIPYEIIGEKQQYIGLRYPCILYTKTLENENKEFIDLWEKYKNEQKNKH